MTTYRFNAYTTPGELDLNRLAVKLGVRRRFRWEEPMRLNPATFLPSAPETETEVYLYYFGGIVFLNCADAVIERFMERLPGYVEPLKGVSRLPNHEEYRLVIDPAEEPSIGNDGAVMRSCSRSFLDIICFVIAKSVALERIEERIDAVFDEVEGPIARMGQGTLELPDRDLARLASSILGFKYASIASIMVLDKPEITWDDPQADRFYTTMAAHFELAQRYQEIKHKSETLLDVTDVFTSLSHARRAARLEWIIIILIVIEIVLYVFQLFWHP